MILILYNPILSLAISSEILEKIGNASGVFKRTARELSESLQNIGLKIALQLSEDLIEKVYMDTDFQGRTLLRIIVDNGLEPLVKCIKVDDLIERLWTGKETYE